MFGASVSELYLLIKSLRGQKIQFDHKNNTRTQEL